jgi:hypothetical protein
LKHQMRPSVEGLENKTLLSHVAASLVAHHFALAHDATLAGSGSMAVTITTNKPAYNPGQVVAMTLTMTNNSNHNERVLVGPSIDGFSITHDGTVIWRSNQGGTPEYIAVDIIKPGQSVSLFAHWTATDTPGSFVAHNQMYPTTAVASFTVSAAPIVPIPVGPIPVGPGPVVPVGPIAFGRA